MNKKSALCIVAHPDDETIWMGGTILKNSDWSWTILSLCRKNDTDRAPKFAKVCKKYNSLGIIADLDDEQLNPLQTRSVVEKIKEYLPDQKYDFIFTHGQNGEYGHVRHKETHRAVKWMIENNFLSCKKLFYFDYVDGKESAPHCSSLKIPVPNSKSNLVVSLD